MSNAEELAQHIESGSTDLDKHVKTGSGSGKNRSKIEQVEHKKIRPEGDTRRIVENILHGKQKRCDEEKKRLEKKESG
ncbi:unnamed protein product [Soboliphyme baturini]|uniref:Uncharacterized protein n=1 Tax=Soboliphyme baturini TaxID=241478 RepID=A0A183IYH4_9BILA|nr:unnamed protein product [Soboliphyme baturini]